MHPLLLAMSAAARARRRGEAAGSTSLVRLVMGEVAWAARQAAHPAKLLAASAAALAIGFLLGPSTPGPTLGAGWRLAAAILVGMLAMGTAHRLLARRLKTRADPLVEAIGLALATAATIVVGVFILSYLLAAVVSAPSEAPAASLSAAMPLDGPLLVGAVLLLSGIVASALSDRMRVPAALLFLGLGMLVGDDGLALIRFDRPDLAQGIGVVALIVVLFDGGLSTSLRQLRQGLAPALTLATLGVGITAGLTAVGAMVVLGLDSRVAWLLGAIVASTDATAVFAALRRAPIPERIASILQVESGANDPVAILLTVGLLAAWNAPPSAGSWVAFGAMQLLGGVAVGVVVGGAGAALLRRLTLQSGLSSVLGLAVAGCAYGLAAVMGGSGFLATFVVGIVLASEVPRGRVALRSFVGTLSSGVEVGLFLLLGLLVFPSQLPSVALTSLAIAAILVLVARPIAVAVSLSWFGIPWREQFVIGWLGMRGAVPIVLATLAYSAGLPEADLIFDVVFFVVVLSMVFQAATTTRLLGWVGLPPGPVKGLGVAEVLPLEGVAMDIIDVELHRGSPLVGVALQRADPPTDVLVVAVVRGGAVLMPRGSTVFEPRDRLVIATPDQDGGRARVEAWVRSAAPPE